MKKLTQSRLKELLSYDPDTGIFTWKISRGGKSHAGDTAGRVNEDGYIIITVDGRHYRGHVLAWLYMTGKMPTRHVDHEDLSRSNNRFGNLRLATNGQNGSNKGMMPSNKCGHKGVCFDPARDKYRATINKDNKQLHLGYFDSLELAGAAYDAAAPIHHGIFARTHSTPRTDESRL